MGTDYTTLNTFYVFESFHNKRVFNNRKCLWHNVKGEKYQSNNVYTMQIVKRLEDIGQCVVASGWQYYDGIMGSSLDFFIYCLLHFSIFSTIKHFYHLRKEQFNFNLIVLGQKIKEFANSGQETKNSTE